MECELVDSSHSNKSTGVEDKKPTTPLSYSEVFQQYLPQYLMMGMTPEQFYDGDSTLTIAYRKSYELKEQEANYHLWLQGLYIYQAVGSLTPILHAFAKQGSKPLPYLDRPIATTKEALRVEKEIQEREEAERQKLKFLMMVNDINKTMKPKEDEITNE